MDLRQQLINRLGAEEGRRKSAYSDSLGYLTIGVGRCIDARLGLGLSDQEIDYLLSNDIDRILSELPEQFPTQYSALSSDESNQDRLAALLDMYFELGDRLQQFATFLSLLASQDFQGAAADLRRTLWYRQVPSRAEHICRVFEGKETY